MFFGSAIRQWLEPVSVMSDIQGFCPTLHTVCYQVGYLAADRGTFFYGVCHSFVSFPG